MYGWGLLHFRSNPVSYSFSVSASTKDEAKKLIAEQFALVVKSQPSHAADEPTAIAAGNAFVDLMDDVPEGQEIYVSMYGSLGWNHDAPGKFLSANVSVSANLRKKPA